MAYPPVRRGRFEGIAAWIGILFWGCVALSGCQAAGEGTGPGNGNDDGQTEAPLLEGRVWLKPGCPAQRPNDPECQPKPVSAPLVLEPKGGGEALARFQSGPDGRFAVELPQTPSGRYRLRGLPINGRVPPFPPSARTLKLKAGAVVEVELFYDSGVR